MLPLTSLDPKEPRESGRPGEPGRPREGTRPRERQEGPGARERSRPPLAFPELSGLPWAFWASWGFLGFPRLSGLSRAFQGFPGLQTKRKYKNKQKQRFVSFPRP